MVQSINLFRWNCLWKTFPCRNKTSIDNTNSEPLKVFLRYTQGSNSEKKLLAEGGSGNPQETKLRLMPLNIAVDLQRWHYRNNECVTPLIFSREITTQKSIYSQHVRHSRLIVFCVGECNVWAVNKKETSFVPVSAFHWVQLCHAFQYSHSIICERVSSVCKWAN